MGTRDLRPKKLGEKLKKIRIDLNLSQGELIERLGFTDVIYQGNISQYELNRRTPPLPILLSYARLIEGITIEALIDDELEIY